jgi:hypothetical protein
VPPGILTQVGSTVSRWGEYGPRPQPAESTRQFFDSLEITESVEVACSADKACALISDVARIGEFSPECVGIRWLDRVEGAVVGAKFEGTNRIVMGDDEFIWIRPCTISHSESGLFGYVVGDRYDGSPASWWRFDVRATGPARCHVQQTFRHDPDGLSGLRSAVDADPACAERLIQERVAGLSDGMRSTLGRMRSVLEGHIEAGVTKW